MVVSTEGHLEHTLNDDDHYELFGESQSVLGGFDDLQDHETISMYMLNQGITTENQSVGGQMQDRVPNSKIRNGHDDVPVSAAIRIINECCFR